MFVLVHVLLLWSPGSLFIAASPRHTNCNGEATVQRCAGELCTCTETAPLWFLHLFDFGRVQGCPKGPDGPYETVPSKFHESWSREMLKSQLFFIFWISGSPNIFKMGFRFDLFGPVLENTSFYFGYLHIPIPTTNKKKQRIRETRFNSKWLEGRVSSPAAPGGFKFPENDPQKK